jgi:hypothetical protein
MSYTSRSLFIHIYEADSQSEEQSSTLQQPRRHPVETQHAKYSSVTQTCLYQLTGLFTTMSETRSQVNQYKSQKIQKTPITGVPNVRITQLGVA